MIDLWLLSVTEMKHHNQANVQKEECSLIEGLWFQKGIKIWFQEAWLQVVGLEAEARNWDHIRKQRQQTRRGYILSKPTHSDRPAKLFWCVPNLPSTRDLFSNAGASQPNNHIPLPGPLKAPDHYNEKRIYSTAKCSPQLTQDNLLIVRHCKITKQITSSNM